MKIVKLSKRLLKIASKIKNGAKVADIGTDHGYLAIYLTQMGIAEHVTASDIAEGPINAAVNNAKQYGVYDKIKFVTAPGLKGVNLSETDTVVIAGMGGETICEILKNQDSLKAIENLILQPQTKLEPLLCELSSYTLKSADLVKDMGRIYVVAVYETIKPQKQSENPLAEFLQILSDSKNPLFDEYMENRKAKERRIAEARGTYLGS